MIRILQGVEQKVITPEQAEWLLNEGLYDAKYKAHQARLLSQIMEADEKDGKDIDVPTIESTLDRMMRECYGCMGKLDIEEDGCVEYHDGKGWHATISLNEPECLCSIGRSDIMVSFEDNCIKYGLKEAPKDREPEKVRAN